MSSHRHTPAPRKDEAVRQVLERSHAVTDVAARVGVSAHSLYKWIRAVKPGMSSQQNAELVEVRAEIVKLRAQLRRAEEERDIVKTVARYIARESE